MKVPRFISRAIFGGDTGFPANVPVVSPDYVKNEIIEAILYLQKLPDDIARTYPNYILIGPPGIGKTQVVYEASREAAEKLGRVFVDITDHRERARVVEELEKDPRASERYFLFQDIRLTEVEPHDVSGIPRDAGRYVEYKPISWAYALSLAPGVLFLDEFTNVQDHDVKAASQKILNEKSAGFVRMHPRSFVVCAGNAPSHSSLADVIPEPVVNRVKIFYVTAGDLNSWIRAVRRRISSIADEDLRESYMATLELLIGFHRRTGSKHLLALPTSRNREIDENYPTPRSWEKLLLATPIEKLRELSHDIDALKAHLAGFVGLNVAGELASYILEGMNKKIEEALKDKSKIDDLDSLERYSLARKVGERIGNAFNERNEVPEEYIDILNKLASYPDGDSLLITALVTAENTFGKIEKMKKKLRKEITKRVKRLQEIEKREKEILEIAGIKADD
jgi:MoxR-like ATPase